jgi:hypothetical protein
VVGRDRDAGHLNLTRRRHGQCLPASFEIFRLISNDFSGWPPWR